jgi:hypothetical protein
MLIPFSKLRKSNGNGQILDQKLSMESAKKPSPLKDGVFSAEIPISISFLNFDINNNQGARMIPIPIAFAIPAQTSHRFLTTIKIEQPKTAIKIPPNKAVSGWVAAAAT